MIKDGYNLPKSVSLAQSVCLFDQWRMKTSYLKKITREQFFDTILTDIEFWIFPLTFPKNDKKFSLLHSNIR